MSAKSKKTSRSLRKKVSKTMGSSPKNPCFYRTQKTKGNTTTRMMVRLTTTVRNQRMKMSRKRKQPKKQNKRE